MEKLTTEERAAEHIRAVNACRSVLKQRAGNKYAVMVAVSDDGRTEITPVSDEGDVHECYATAAAIGLFLENLEREHLRRMTLPAAAKAN